MNYRENYREVKMKHKHKPASRIVAAANTLDSGTEGQGQKALPLQASQTLVTI